MVGEGEADDAGGRVTAGEQPAVVHGGETDDGGLAEQQRVGGGELDNGGDVVAVEEVAERREGAPPGAGWPAGVGGGVEQRVPQAVPGGGVHRGVDDGRAPVGTGKEAAQAVRGGRVDGGPRLRQLGQGAGEDRRVGAVQEPDQQVAGGRRGEDRGVQRLPAQSQRGGPQDGVVAAGEFLDEPGRVGHAGTPQPGHGLIQRLAARLRGEPAGQVQQLGPQPGDPHHRRDGGVPPARPGSGRQVPAVALEQVSGGEGDLRCPVDAARIVREEPGRLRGQEPRDLVAGVGFARQALAEPAHREEPQPRIGVPGKSGQQAGRAGGAVDVGGEPVRVAPPDGGGRGFRRLGHAPDPRQPRKRIRAA
ncbi:hypothetical protein [Dactylosporangium cerinum]